MEKTKDSIKYHYHPLKSFFAKRLLDEVYNLVKKGNTRTIIDIGCGEGYPDQYLLARNPKIEIVGIDIDCRAIDIAKRKNSAATYEEGDIYNLSYGEDEYDLALVLEVLEHLNDVGRAVEEVKRVARKAIFSVPQEPLFSLASFVSGNYVKSGGKHPDHINFWNRDSFKKLLLKEYIEVEIKTVFPWIIAYCRK